MGSVAEEAARLLAALNGRAETRTDGAEWWFAEDFAGASSREGAASEHLHHPPAGEALTCALCPVCQAIALLREVHPETIDRLADLASAASAALRDLAVQVAAQRGDSGAAKPRPRRSAAEDIEVTGPDLEVPS